MFKTFTRTIVFQSVSKENFKIIINHTLQERTQVVRSFSKPKKSKKMLRTWEFTEDARELQQQPKKHPFQQFRLISYNILAQDLLVEHYYLYQGINSQHLRWDHRLCCLKNELNYLDPDIMCVQEMQFNHIKEFVGRLSDKRKLEYIFKKKTGHRTDGCAIIYDKEKFKLLADRDIEFYKPSSNNLNRENIALLAKFQLRHEPEKHIVIGTTHLLFNPRRHDVRVAQVELLLEHLESFARKCIDDENKYLPVILTGDFNSEPNSPPFVRLTTPYDIKKEEKVNEVNVTNGLDNDESCQIIDENVLNKIASHHFKLSNVDFGRSCASTFHDRWITVDYVLRSVKYDEKEDKDAREKSDVKVLSIYKLPTVRNCERIGKIPNQYLGSDHYLQAIEFIVV